MDFEVVGDIGGIETIATGSGIRERGRLRKRYGQGRWRKRKGFAEIRLVGGLVSRHRHRYRPWTALHPRSHDPSSDRRSLSGEFRAGCGRFDGLSPKISPQAPLGSSVIVARVNPHRLGLPGANKSTFAVKIHRP